MSLSIPVPWLLTTWLASTGTVVGYEWMLRWVKRRYEAPTRDPSTIFLRQTSRGDTSAVLPTSTVDPITVGDTPCFGIDLGGTMCKITYLEKFPSTKDTPAQIAFRNRIREVMEMKETYGETGFRDFHLEFDSAELGGHVCFTQFETRKMARFIEMCRINKVVDSTTQVYGTGGGARKYSRRIKDLLNVSIHYCDELQSLISGINFLLQRDPEALYRVDPSTFRTDGKRLAANGPGSAMFPYLLVNIGSGVSIMKVSEDGNHTRIGGTSLGGASFFGLCALITGCSKFSEAMGYALKGDAKNVDLLVGDIYGGDYAEYKLSGDTVASSLGKLVRPEVRDNAKHEDVCRAILDAITNNVGSLAHLHARNEGISRIVFSGNFLRGNRISIARLSYAMKFWSGGERHALFLRHEGYMGSIGAMLSRGVSVNNNCNGKGQEVETDRGHHIDASSALSQNLSS
eukprot:m.97182 g.97182  ORF g.97182 m.97182 type:complete len:458 (-) comp26956_c1_seq2:625-1998(-)